jgi:hypothetical protein
MSNPETVVGVMTDKGHLGSRRSGQGAIPRGASCDSRSPSLSASVSNTGNFDTRSAPGRLLGRQQAQGSLLVQGSIPAESSPSSEGLSPSPTAHSHLP